MYAVVNSGGKQYKVEEGETLKVEKIPGAVGSSVKFDRVLMISDGDTVKASTLMESARVSPATTKPPLRSTNSMAGTITVSTVAAVITMPLLLTLV